jgi:hypothetical protein
MAQVVECLPDKHEFKSQYYQKFIKKKKLLQNFSVYQDLSQLSTAGPLQNSIMEILDDSSDPILLKLTFLGAFVANNKLKTQKDWINHFSEQDVAEGSINFKDQMPGFMPTKILLLLFH